MGGKRWCPCSVVPRFGIPKDGICVKFCGNRKVIVV